MGKIPAPDLNTLIKQGRFTCFWLGKTFEKQVKAIEEKTSRSFTIFGIYLMKKKKQLELI